MPKIAEGTLFGIVHDFLKIYLPKQRRLSNHTVRVYREALEQLFDFVKQRKNISLVEVTFEMLTSEMICAFLDNIETERGCSIVTRNHRLTAIKAFTTYVATIDISFAANLTELKKVPKKKATEFLTVDYMTENAVSAVLNAPNTATDKGVRDRFLMILLYDTAARVQEIVDVKLCDFRLGKTPTVTLYGKGGKVRTVPLMENTVKNLMQYMALFHPDEKSYCERPLFYSVINGILKPLSDRRVRKFIEHYGVLARKKCNEVPENVHPHLFRHSRAMHLYQHGMDLTLVSQWLGHAHLETTLIYCQR